MWLNQVIKLVRRGLLHKEVFFAVLLLVAVPFVAHAGIFSFTLQVLGGEGTGIVYNSQTMPLLRAAVNIDPNPSKGGGDITIVEGQALLAETGPSGTMADIEDASTGGQISVYVVREGDSLSQIAKMFGVSSNTIVWANDIKRGSLIHEGQTLIILPVTGVRHTVASGDTIQSITKKYKGDVKEILQYNDFGEDVVLVVGSIVVIPDGEIETPKYTPSYSRRIVRGTGGPSYDGYYLRPVIGGIRSQDLHGYNAIDIAAPYGTPIMAAADGTVIITRDYGWNGGYGKYVAISHENGTQTLYAHNSSNIVYVGQPVVKGQVIAYMGATGRSTGNHVHFEIRGAKNPF
mgnify:CR=1 FL=1|jgi:LysM repeat protein|tara:strand:+ start:8225 stop:9262 length:1038 start_codon:yes stop_codon:yes gene_type:complete